MTLLCLTTSRSWHISRILLTNWLTKISQKKLANYLIVIDVMCVLPPPPTPPRASLRWCCSTIPTMKTQTLVIAVIISSFNYHLYLVSILPYVSYRTLIHAILLGKFCLFFPFSISCTISYCVVKWSTGSGWHVEVAPTLFSGQTNPQGHRQLYASSYTNPTLSLIMLQDLSTLIDPLSSPATQKWSWHIQSTPTLATVYASSLNPMEGTLQQAQQMHWCPYGMQKSCTAWGLCLGKWFHQCIQITSRWFCLKVSVSVKAWKGTTSYGQPET